ncbi:hypothetical protein JMJ35_007017 [Cladonia borealis]|uniref:Nucleotide-diphospho-sugar transferase n=1 Tax=Cladonia borealis TaxID=184061 RepID=A0AA39V7M6_9LECA|nr:hypothetical protein JMJ35_007017 [Cladonia borealis]
MVQYRRFYLIAIFVFLAMLFLLTKSLLPGRRLMGGFRKMGGHSDRQDPIDWSRFAYVQYVTNLPYLCNSVMLFEALHRLGCMPDRLMMYPDHFSLEDNSTEAILLRKARDEYKVILKPIEVQRRGGNDPTWAESYTKLLAFNQTDYQRILHLDSDSTVLQNLDELFFIEPAFVAMPRAYWLGFQDRILSSQLLLLQPNKHEFDRVMKATSGAGGDDYDMDLLNNLYKDNALVLPHRPYDLLTGEFRGEEHSKYIGDGSKSWDPDYFYKECKFLHFSDWPLPKPWIATKHAVDEAKPPCRTDPKTNQTLCREQEIWVDAYADYRRRRKEVCDMIV